MILEGRRGIFRSGDRLDRSNPAGWPSNHQSFRRPRRQSHHHFTFHPHRPSIHLPFSPHLGEPPRCACRSAFLTSSRADWLIAAEWGSLPTPPPSPPPSPSPRRRSESQSLQFESEFRVADSAVHFHFSPHFHFVVLPSDAAASSVWAGRVRRARFFAV